MTTNCKEKQKEYRQNWVASMTKEEFRALNKKHTKKWRDQNKEYYRRYQREYHIKWREDPSRRYTQLARNSLISSLKGSKKAARERAAGKTCDHIIPLLWLAEFYISRGFDLNVDSALNAALHRCSNNCVNIRWIPAEKNKRNIYPKREVIVNVARRLEKLYPFFMRGLVEFVISRCEQEMVQ